METKSRGGPGCSYLCPVGEHLAVAAVRDELVWELRHAGVQVVFTRAQLEKTCPLPPYVASSCRNCATRWGPGFSYLRPIRKHLFVAAVRDKIVLDCATQAFRVFSPVPFGKHLTDAPARGNYVTRGSRLFLPVPSWRTLGKTHVRCRRT